MDDPTTGYITEDREMIRDEAREFTENEILPLAAELDPEHGDIPERLVKKLAEMDYFGILIPEDYGGLGLGAFEYCLITEELARGWMSVASLLARGNGFPGQEAADEALKRDMLPRMARGQVLSAAAISEPDVGSDLANIACTGKREGSDWVLNGSKYWCTYADRADAIFIAARTSDQAGEERSEQGISLFRLPKPRGSFPEGVSAQPIPTIGCHGVRTYALEFDNCHLPGDALVGEEGLGCQYLSAGTDTNRAHTAALSIGQAQGALEVAIQHAHDREQFDQPIANFQAIRFMVADMATDIAAARQLMYHVCTVIDASGGSSLEASMLKLFAGEMSERVTSLAFQILAGAGYTTHFPVERYWRDARLTKILEGSSELQKSEISDELLGSVKQ